MKKYGAVYLLCVCMAQRTYGVMKNKPVFHLNSGSSTFNCVKGILYPVIPNTNSLIVVKFLEKRWYCEIVLWWNGIVTKWWNGEMVKKTIYINNVKVKWCY